MYTTYRSASFAHSLYIAIHTFMCVVMFSGALYVSFHVGQQWSFASDKGVNALLVLVLIVGAFMLVQFWLFVRKYYVVHVELRTDGNWYVLSTHAYASRRFFSDSQILQFSVFESYLENKQVLNQYIAKCMKLEGYV